MVCHGHTHYNTGHRQQLSAMKMKDSVRRVRRWRPRRQRGELGDCNGHGFKSRKKLQRKRTWEKCICNSPPRCSWAKHPMWNGRTWIPWLYWAAVCSSVIAEEKKSEILFIHLYFIPAFLSNLEASSCRGTLCQKSSFNTFITYRVYS